MNPVYPPTPPPPPPPSSFVGRGYNDFIYTKQLYEIIHPCPNLKGNSIKLLLNLGMDEWLYLQKQCVWLLWFPYDDADDAIKWKHFPCYWPFVWGIHWSPVNSPHKSQWGRALMFSLICAWTNAWSNNEDVSDLRCHRAHYVVIVMINAQQNHLKLWIFSERTLRPNKMAEIYSWNRI